MPKNIQLLAAARKAQDAGDARRAADLLRQYLSGDPSHLDSLLRLGRLLRALRDVNGSLQALTRAHQLKPDSVEALHELGQTLVAAQRVAEGVDAFRRAVSLDPARAESHLNLGLALTASFQPDAAIRALRRAHELAPDDPRVCSALGGAYLNQGLADRAVPCYRAALARRPDIWDQANLATALRLDGQYEAALAEFDRALAMHPGFPSAVAGKAELLESHGRSDEAMAIVEPEVRAGDLSPHLVVAYARLCKLQGRPQDAAPVLERSAQVPGMLPRLRSLVLFNLGSIKEAMGDLDGAWACFERGNALYPRTFRRSEHEAQTARLIEAFAPGRFAALPRAADRSRRPVFIVGMPRSGTSLVEQILACHPRVFGGGERPDIPGIVTRLPDLCAGVPYPACLAGLTPETVDRLAREHLDRLATLAPDADRVTDKMPHNFLHVGLLAVLFPGAAIIHTRRHPLDTCLSCYCTPFTGAHSYSNDLLDLACAYREYRRLTDHWFRTLRIPVLEVDYERLTADPEPTVRAMLDHCGLEWHEGCLHFHESDRIVRTASMDQIRRPLYRTSVEKWRRYERQLEPLRAALEDLLPGAP